MRQPPPWAKATLAALAKISSRASRTRTNSSLDDRYIVRARFSGKVRKSSSLQPRTQKEWLPGRKGRRQKVWIWERMAGGLGFEPRLAESESHVISDISTTYDCYRVKTATNDQYVTRTLSKRDGPPGGKKETAVQAGPLNGGGNGNAEQSGTRDLDTSRQLSAFQVRRIRQMVPISEVAARVVAELAFCNRRLA